MDEYIKREKAIEAIDESLKRVFVVPAGKSIMDKVPTADVREVVLCRDCRYYPSGTDDGEDQGLGLEWPDKELYKCPFMCPDGWYSKKPRPDFFCANGVKRHK